MKSKADDKQYVGFYITKQEYTELRKLADIEQCVTVNRFVRELVKQEVRKQEKTTTDIAVDSNSNE